MNNSDNAFDLSSEECSSGCESGWTLYLQEHSFLNHHQNNNNASGRGGGGGEGSTHHQFMGKSVDDDDDDEDGDGEEEDLSMVSDASSGPPPHNLPEQDNNHGCLSPLLQRSSKKRQKVIKEKNQRHFEDQQHLPSFLDDTASSPLLFDFSMNNVNVTNQQTSTESMLDYSQGFSATYYFEGRSSLQDHYGFLQPHNLSSETTQVHHGNKWYRGD